MIYGYNGSAIMAMLIGGLATAAFLLYMFIYILIKGKGRSRLKMLLLILLLTVGYLGVRFTVNKLDSVDSGKAAGFIKYSDCELVIVYKDFYVFSEGVGPYQRYFAVPTSADCPDKMKEKADYYIYTPGDGDSNDKYLFFNDSKDGKANILSESCVVVRDHSNISTGAFLLYAVALFWILIANYSAILMKNNEEKIKAKQNLT